MTWDRVDEFREPASGCVTYIGWIKISAKFNIQPGPFYSSKKSILRGWKKIDFLVQPPAGVTWDKCSTSATSTQPVTAEPFEMVQYT